MAANGWDQPSDLPPAAGAAADVDVDADADVVGPFHRSAALVGAAFAAARALPDALDALAARLRAPDAPGVARDLLALRELVEAAGRDGRNLLVRRPGDPARFLAFGLVRQPSGAMGVRPIEVDLAAIALVEPGGGVLDRLETAVRADEPAGHPVVGERLRALRARVGAATSRLSVAKARLDVQATFLAALFAAGRVAPAPPLAGQPLMTGPSFSSDLDLAGARTMALDTRRRLGGRGIAAGGDGRAAIRGLFRDGERG